MAKWLFEVLTRSQRMNIEVRTVLMVMVSLYLHRGSLAQVLHSAMAFQDWLEAKTCDTCFYKTVLGIDASTLATDALLYSNSWYSHGRNELFYEHSVVSFRVLAHGQQFDQAHGVITITNFGEHAADVLQISQLNQG